MIFRSRDIWGPYEGFGGNPILTQRDLPADRPSPVTCTGHADLVQTPAGDWMAVFLGCRPYAADHFSTGRETFLHPVDWSGEWPIILPPGTAVPATVPVPATAGQTTFSVDSANWRDDFDQPALGSAWNFIRTPHRPWHELRAGALVMQARPVPIAGLGNPSFVGRRLQHANADFSTEVALEAGKDLEAGVVAFQNERFLSQFTLVQAAGRCHLAVSSAGGEAWQVPLADPPASLCLRMQLRGSALRCQYSRDGQAWTEVGEALDATHLSTKTAGGFVGAYLGLYAFAETPARATFAWAAYNDARP